MSLSLPFKRIADCREMTRSVLIIDRSVITSSVRPSAKRSLSCSALTLANGSTAIVASSVDPVDRAPGACPEARLYRTSMISRSEEHTSELQSQSNLVCRLLLEKKKNKLNFEFQIYANI